MGIGIGDHTCADRGCGLRELAVIARGRLVERTWSAGSSATANVRLVGDTPSIADLRARGDVSVAAHAQPLAAARAWCQPFIEHTA